jgi:hypothetical protein
LLQSREFEAQPAVVAWTASRVPSEYKAAKLVKHVFIFCQSKFNQKRNKRNKLGTELLRQSKRRVEKDNKKGPQ